MNALHRLPPIVWHAIAGGALQLILLMVLL